MPDQNTPRPLRDAAREFAAQVRQVERKQEAHDREKKSFLQKAVVSTLEAIKASANPAREASLRRIADQRAVLEARLPEQYRAQYLAYAEKLDTQMQRQEKRLAQRWESAASGCRSAWRKHGRHRHRQAVESQDLNKDTLQKVR